MITTDESETSVAVPVAEAVTDDDHLTSWSDATVARAVTTFSSFDLDMVCCTGTGWSTSVDGMVVAAAACCCAKSAVLMLLAVRVPVY